MKEKKTLEKRVAELESGNNSSMAVGSKLANEAKQRSTMTNFAKRSMLE